MDKKDLKTIENETANLLELVGVEGKVSAAIEEDVARVNIDTTETGILIGYHGETLYGLQLILGLVCLKKLGHWVRIVVNVGDYRQKREEYLQQLARSKAEAVLSTGAAQTLSGLSPFERRVVHMLISSYDNLTSESVGEGEERKLVIKPKQI